MEMGTGTVLKYALSSAGFLVTCAAALFFKKKGIAVLQRWAEKTEWPADDLIVKALKGHIVFWLFLLGTFLFLVPLFPENAAATASRVVLISFLASVTMVCSVIVTGLITLYSRRLGTTVAMSGLTVSFSRIAVYALGGLMILNSLGISITPLLTTLGIGGLAVALALQDTLSNLFAGFHVIIDRQVKIGDYIKLESGQEGYVRDINWRTTKIRVQPNNNIVLVPNARLAQIIVTNYYLPQKEIALTVDAGVHYDSDLEKVEAVTLDVARQVMREVEGAVAGFEPLFRYHTFDASSINFTVILRAREFFDQYKVKHEFIKRLHRRFKEEDIVIPYPIAALNISQEGTFKYLQKGV